MPKYYKIKSTLPGLAGLIVETIKEPAYGVYVDAFINSNSIVGDRTVKYPQPSEAIWINLNHLEEVENPGTREFANDNPFGKFLFEGHLQKDDLKVDYTQYENGVSVTIREDTGSSGRTLYTQNFFKESAAQAMQTVSEVLLGDTDVDDLVFSLKDLKAKEKHG